VTDVPGLESDEVDLVLLFVHLRRFEKGFRQFLLDRLSEQYGAEVTDRVKRILGEEDYEAILEWTIRQHIKYGQTPPPQLDLADVFENLGFEHYLKFVGNANCWERCFTNFLITREEVLTSLGRIKDARNEVMHTRNTIHPLLWPSCRLEIDCLLGQITMGRAKLQDWVNLVQGGVESPSSDH
jgi:hypothetical protein